MNPATAADPLAQLRDIHLPEDIPWWPPAPGWWILGLLVLLGLLALILWLNSRRRANAYRRAALQQLDRILAATKEPKELLVAINRLLKRTALAAYPNRQIAGLHGQQWARFLGASAPTTITPELEALLTENLYSPAATESPAIEEFTRFSRQWIAKHQHTSQLRPGEQPC